MKVTADECVRALKTLGTSSRASTVASFLGTESRAVATALRKPSNDGRVSVIYQKGVAWYRFKRVTPKSA